MKNARCPICREKSATAYRPFCSLRCADIDLGKWMTGEYSVPSQREDDREDLEKELLKTSQDRDPNLH